MPAFGHERTRIADLPARGIGVILQGLNAWRSLFGYIVTQPTVFTYVDHNVLDLMTKGDPDGLSELFRQTNMVPVFSDENLAEIQRSIGYERKFLDLLQRIGARYLVPVLDETLRHTGRAEIRQVDPLDVFGAYTENVNALPDSGFGLSGMLQKFYGGRENQSFGEILSGGAEELRQLLKKVEEELRDIPGIDNAMRVAVAQAVSNVPQLMEEEYKNFAKQLDTEPTSAVKRLEEVTGLGPKALQSNANIRPPGVVRKIWELVEAKLQSVDQGEGGLDLETFFGIKPHPFEADASRERTLLEKVNAVYHQLNFLGYYRDSNMGRRRRFVASFSDMTHAGLASFCHVLICRDEDLVMKAAAAYEHLNVGTTILHYRANRAG
jgi:hypothetical protein